MVGTWWVCVVGIIMMVGMCSGYNMMVGMCSGYNYDGGYVWWVRGGYV